MPRTTFIVLVGLVVAHSAFAQSTAELIEQAVAPLPARARNGALVIRWNADYTYETLREGTNTWVCYHRSDEGRRPPFAVQCTSRANLDRVAQNRKFRAESANAQEEQAMVAAAEQDGTRVPPEYGSMFVSMNGDDQLSATIHTTIAVPGGTPESLGLPGDPSQGGAWVMDAGTSAHIMVPGR